MAGRKAAIGPQTAWKAGVPQVQAAAEIDGTLGRAILCAGSTTNRERCFSFHRPEEIHRARVATQRHVDPSMSARALMQMDGCTCEVLAHIFARERQAHTSLGRCREGAVLSAEERLGPGAHSRSARSLSASSSPRRSRTIDPVGRPGEAPAEWAAGVSMGKSSIACHGVISLDAS